MSTQAREIRSRILSTKSGLHPANQITDSDLEENGGDYVLRSGTAVPVSLFTNQDRPLVQGAATPIYIVTQAQVDSGEFIIRQDRASLPMFLVSDTPVSGKTAVPVFVTENY